MESCGTGGAAPADRRRPLGGRGVKREPRPLSARQEAVMAVVRSWIIEHGHGPTIREIGARVGLSSTSSVAYQLRQLEERGLISRTGREWSSCRLESPRPSRRGLRSR
ncbi:winged helix DNA-binding protein [Streptomyces microflavus]|uniref:LexA family protein n=1 Tax=Streptomyces microflavus TaxID=1919 RepID=UPI00341B0DDD